MLSKLAIYDDRANVLVFDGHQHGPRYGALLDHHCAWYAGLVLRCGADDWRGRGNDDGRDDDLACVD